MRTVFLAASMLFSLSSHGQNVEMEWNGGDDDMSSRSCIPVVDIDYDNKDITLEIDDESSSAVVVISDITGEFTYKKVPSGKKVTLNVGNMNGNEIRLDVYVDGLHGVGYLQKED